MQGAQSATLDLVGQLGHVADESIQNDNGVQVGQGLVKLIFFRDVLR